MDGQELTTTKQKKGKLPLQAKVSLAYTVCSIVQKCLSFLTLPFFSRLLSVTQYGQYSVYASWMAILSIFLTLNLSFGTLSKAMVKFEGKRNEYISNVQTICVLLCAVFLAIYLPLRGFFNSIFDLPTLIILVLVLEVLMNVSTSCWMEKQRFEYKYVSVIVVTLITAVLSVGLAFACVFLSEERGYARIVGYAAGVVLVGIVFFILNYIRGKKVFDKEMWKFALGMNLPLIVYYLSQVVFNHIDRIMISNMVGLDKAGIYGVAYNLAIMLTFVQTAINNSYLPWFYGKIKEGKQSENKKTACGIAVIMGVLLIGLTWIAPEVIWIMADTPYLEAKWIVAPVAMSVLLLFYSQLFINIEFYYEKRLYLVLASVAAAVLNVVLNYFGIKHFGYLAAGYTTLISYFVFFLGNFIAYKRIVKKNGLEDNFFNFKLLMLILIIFLVLGFLALPLYNLPIVRYIIIGIVLLAMLINIKRIKKFVVRILKRKEDET